MDRFEARQGSTMTTSVYSPCLKDFGNATEASSIPSPCFQSSHQHQLKSAESMELASPTRKTAHAVISHELDKMAGSSELESVLGEDKVYLEEQREEEGGDPIDRMMKYACRPPSMALTGKQSKFVATGRSHSFGGEQHQFMAAVGAGLMGVGQVQNSPSANLSLHSLITRARRGGRTQPPYSANVSPILGGCTNTSSSGGRPLVKLDVKKHQDITQVIAELTESEDFQGVQSPSEDEESQYITRPSCQRPKRISSCSIAAGFQSLCPVTPLSPHQAHNKRSRKLIPVECDDGSTHSPSSCSLSQDQISLLRLPDPSTISNRRDLFAVSRKMCSRSSIESFGSQAPLGGSSPAGQEQSSEQGLSSPAEIGVVSSHTMDRENHREVIKGAISEDAAEHEDLASTATATVDDLSEQSFTSTASLCSLPVTPLQTRTSSSSAPEGPQSKHDEESIAFSMDSVHVRKKQIDSSQHTSFNRANRQQAFCTGWAGDSLHSLDFVDDEAEAEDQRPRRVTRNRDRQQPRTAQQIVVCEFDLDAMQKGSFSQGAFPVRSQPSGVDRYEPEDDECSFASVSSLGTIISGQVLHMDFVE